MYKKRSVYCRRFLLHIHSETDFQPSRTNRTKALLSIIMGDCTATKTFTYISFSRLFLKI